MQFPHASSIKVNGNIEFSAVRCAMQRPLVVQFENLKGCNFCPDSPIAASDASNGGRNYEPGLELGTFIGLLGLLDECQTK
jgi:hypothetical protein